MVVVGGWLVGWWFLVGLGVVSGGRCGWWLVLWWLLGLVVVRWWWIGGVQK